MFKRLTFSLLVLIFVWIMTSPGTIVAQQDSPLFTLLDSDQTGIHFNNQVEDTKDHNILIYSNYYGGAGVAIADFNNDGMQDICFGGNLVADQLYLNEGNFKFRDVSQAAGIKDNGGWSSGVIAADVNNDGWMDLYITRELYDNEPELRSNQLYINQGVSSNDGVPYFKESAHLWGVDDQRRSRHAVFLDYDKDGFLDLFVLNQPPNPGNFSELYGVKPSPESAPRLYRNLGDRFQDVTQKAQVGIPGYPNSVSVTDTDNDGWPDIYVANDFGAPDFLYINNGDGTFRETIQQSTRHISYFSMGVDAADINNDGWTDLMVLDMVAEDNFRLKANMSGMNPDAFWKVVDDGGHYQYMYNTLHLNQGNFQGNPIFGDIAQIASVSSTDWSWSNLIADFDNDGYKDIHVTNGLMRDIRNTDADKKFSEYVEKISYEWIDENPNAGTVSIWEIIDLEEALKIVPSQELPNYSFKNNGDLTFTKIGESWGLDQPSFSNGSAYGDLDNDGDLDLVVNNVNDMAFVYRNNAEILTDRNYFRVQLTDSMQNRPLYGSKIHIQHGDLSQWYEFTNVRGMYSTSENIAHFGVGSATSINSIKVTWPDGKVSILQDQPANQLIVLDRGQSSEVAAPVSKAPPLFLRRAETPASHEENTFDDFEKQVLLPHKMSQFGPAMAAGDVNGDGTEDIFLGGAKDHPGQLLLQNPGGGFEIQPVQAFLQDNIHEDVAAVWFDLDNDKDLDLYVVSGGNEWAPGSPEYQDRIYLNDGNGGLTRSKHDTGIRSSGSCVLPYDYDSDGDTDLFVGGRHIPWDYPAPASSTILENRNGDLVDVTQSLAKDLKKAGLVTDGVWTDFDGDGLTDLVLSGEWMPLTFLRNDGKKFLDVTKRMNTNVGHGWWYSIAAKDIDGDGDQDLVAGNLGLNYKYKASKNEPFEVFYDDFDESGTKDIVLSYYNFGDRFPLRGRSCSAEQIPDLKYEFPTYQQFAAANLTDVYGLSNLNQALHYQAQNFASVWLENHGSGRFVAHELPNEAQLSSINDILIHDLNQDGFQDLLLAGNLYAAEIETPRNDASVGVVLLGDKNQEFTALMPQQSGLQVPFDVKKILLIKSGQNDQVLFGVNNGPMQWFEISTSGAKLITN